MIILKLDKELRNEINKYEHYRNLCYELLGEKLDEDINPSDLYFEFSEDIFELFRLDSVMNEPSSKWRGIDFKIISNSKNYVTLKIKGE